MFSLQCERINPTLSKIHLLKLSRILRGPCKIIISRPSCSCRSLVGFNESSNVCFISSQDGQYTIKKLPVTKLGGRNPETGRKVIQRFGGGSKQKYRWIDWRRLPADWNKEEDYVERVLSLNYDPCRDARIMLTGHGEKLRWQIATTTVQV